MNILYRLPKIPLDPVINSIAPTNAYAGASGFTLTVTGKNFVRGATVLWQGQVRTTTFVADTILRASILASDVAVIDTPLVTVKQPITIGSTDSVESNGIRFRIYAQPSVPSILSQIDALRAALASAFAKKQIGDKNFVKELDNHLENARKHLLRRDSINCGKEITKFQEKLYKEYEKTREDDKKRKPRDKRFVTEQGYKLLNDIAQAVLVRLPVKK